MIFYVAYSAEARQDLRDIYEYIAYELLVPETAAGQWLHCSEREEIAIQVVGRWLPRSRWTDFEKLCINFLYR